MTLEEAVGEQDQTVAFWQLELADRPLVGAETESWACRRLEPPHIAVAMHQHARVTRADRGEAQAVGSERKAQERREDSLCRAFGEQNALELAHPLVSA